MSVETGSVLLLWLFLSATFSGSETGFYSLSRVRLSLELNEGHVSARLLDWLLANDTALLVTILIGNNLALEMATHVADDVAVAWGVPESRRELFLTLVLTPIVFMAGEVLPKELFRSRPHTWLPRAAPVVALARIVFWPLERVLTFVARAMERLLGVEEGALRRSLDRESLTAFLGEGARRGAIEAHAHALARNVLRLTGTPVARVMVPWAEVLTLSTEDERSDLFARVRTSEFSRLPTVDGAGRVTGYVRQLEILAAGPEADPFADRRPLEVLGSDIPVERALVRMRRAGLRIALVGTPAVPEGLLTLKDLVEEISGELADF